MTVNAKTKIGTFLIVGSLLLASLSLGGTGGLFMETVSLDGSFTAGNTDAVTDLPSGNDATVTIETTTTRPSTSENANSQVAATDADNTTTERTSAALNDSTTVETTTSET